MNIRLTTDQDRDDIRRVYDSAFPAAESGIVGTLAVKLDVGKTTPPTISLVAERDGRVSGHVAFSPVSIVGSERCRAYILAPLAVQRDQQKCGIGSALVEDGVQRLMEQGVHLVFVYGDPEYYGRFGFNAESARNYTTPYELHYPFGWQACVLGTCPTAELPAVITCVAALNDPDLW